MKRKRMLTLILLVIIIVVVTAIVALAIPKDKHGANPTKRYAIHLSGYEFSRRVADYTLGARWNYVGDRPAIVDFYADWCGPCNKLSPVLEKLAGQYDGRIYVYKVNVDENPDVASAFRVTNIPALLFIPMEGSPQMSVGYKSGADIERLIHSVLLVE